MEFNVQFKDGKLVTNIKELIRKDQEVKEKIIQDI